METKKKRKIKFGGLLVLLLFLYLLVTLFLYFWNMPIKEINIKGNSYLKENYIINYLDLENKSIIKTSKKSIKNKLLELGLISDATIKKNYLGKLYIEVKENKVLFYNLISNKIVLSNGSEIDYSEEFLGIPTLINIVPDEVYKEFIKKMNKINDDTLKLISEIEYSPSKVNDKIVDEYRFIFKMIDENKVYINTTNIEKFNNYLDIYEVIVNKNGDKKGCLYLDSNSTSHYFNDCSTPVKESEKDE